MNKVHKFLNITMLGAFFGAVIMTWLAPRIIEMFLTPPVSFGVNCEPAAVYSMQKLILCQVIGLVIGALLFLAIRVRFFGGKKQDNANNTSATPPTASN